MQKFVYGTLLLTLFFFSAQALAQENIPETTQRYVVNEVIIKFKPSAMNLQKSNGIKSMQNFAVNQQLSSESIIPAQNISVMKIEDGQSVTQVIQDLQNDPNVEYSQPNFIYTIQTTNPNDPDFNLQRWLKNTTNSGMDIHWNAAMDIWSGDGNQNTTGTLVAVIDDGLRYTHPEFAGQLWDWSNCRDSQNVWIGWCTYGFDTFNSGSILPYGDKDPLPNGSDTHGTHVAGIIWAKTNNGIGIAGINPWAKIMAIRAGSWIYLYTDDIINAINFAKNNGAKIINASRWWVASTCMDFSGYRDQLMYTTIKNFPWLFITAAGNWLKIWSNYVWQQHLNNRYVAPADYNTTTSCRSGLDNIISVAASDTTDHLATFSDYWSTINIAAPGVNIESTIWTSDYASWDWTSMATPFVTAVASLARSMRPELSYLDIKSAIINQAEYVSALNGYVAWGKRLNAYTTLYSLLSPSGSIRFLSWTRTNTTWAYIRLTASMTWTYEMSGVWMIGLLTWNISLTWVDVQVSLTSWDAVKNIAVVFFDTVAKPSQVYTASIILDTTPPTLPLLITPTSWISISWAVNLLWNTSLDTWWMSGYYYEVSSDSNMNSRITTWVVYTTWASIYLFSWNTYYRRVRAFDMLGQNSDFSETWSFVLLRDSRPDIFSFTAIGGAELSTEYISNQISISWINTGSTISIVWWTYQINATWNFMSTTWMVYNWDTIKVKLTSFASYSSAITARVNIGGTLGDFIVTTKSAPSWWWGGWGWWWGGWWGWSTPTLLTCIISQLTCSWGIYLIKSWGSCEWGDVGKICSIVTWTVLSGKILSGTIPKYTIFTTTNNWWFSVELLQAYNYAYSIGITTISNIQQADLTGTLIRKHLAKMISNFAIKQMNRVPNTWMKCNFSDMDIENTEMKFYSKLACQLGLMGLDANGLQVSTFSPNDEVTRAQFGTVLSRTLRGNQYNGGEPFYIFHLNALQKAVIMKQIDTPENKELRWYVMLMLMRSVE